MKNLLLVLIWVTLQTGKAQETIVRNPGEKADHLVKRFFKTVEDSASLNDSTLSFQLVHPVVEISFGEGDAPKIVTCFTMSGSFGICTGLWVPDKNNAYDFFYLGGDPFGVAPDMDSIRSIFTCDRNGDGKKELLVLCQGGEKVVHDGLMGCCDPFYFTNVYTFSKNNFEEVEAYTYYKLDTAAKVKAAIARSLKKPSAKAAKNH